VFTAHTSQNAIHEGIKKFMDTIPLHLFTNKGAGVQPLYYVKGASNPINLQYIPSIKIKHATKQAVYPF
jgi:hypothetical protein